MGPDDGVMMILKHGVGSTKDYGVVTALWKRSGTYYAEARVFLRSSPDIEGMVETIRVQAAQSDLATAQLEEKVAKKFGSLKWLRWSSTYRSRIQ